MDAGAANKTSNQGCVDAGTELLEQIPKARGAPRAGVVHTFQLTVDDKANEPQRRGYK